MADHGKKLRVLTVTSNALSCATGIGSTFINFFFGMEGVELANIYTGYGLPNAPFGLRSFRITEKSLLKNLLSPKTPSGEEVTGDSAEALTDSERRSYDSVRKSRPRILFFLRELLWAVGRVESKELRSFVSGFEPDVIFAIINDTRYLTKLVQRVKRMSGRPVCLFIADDFCSLKRRELSPFFWIGRLIKRSAHGKLIRKCSKVFMMTDIAKREYDSMYGVDCGIMTKSLDFSGEPPKLPPFDGPLRFVYTGNLYNGRWQQLAALGRAIERVNEEKIGHGAELEIWSMTPMTEEMERALSSPHVHFMGGAPASEMPAIQAAAHVLVHAESTSKREAAVVRLSFSTKLVDYMRAGRGILAIGPAEQASIAHLKEYSAAVCVTEGEELYPAVRKLASSEEAVRSFAAAAWECGKKNHNSASVRPAFLAELERAAGRTPSPEEQ